MTEREKVNFRVPKQVKKAYENRIREEYAQGRPYKGIILELELEVYLETGGMDEVFDSLQGGSGKNDSKKKNREPMPTGGESKSVQYRIDSDIKSMLKSMASKSEMETSGDILARVMWSYATGNGYYDRIIDLATGEKGGGEYEDLSATERRKEEIKDYLKSHFGDGERVDEPIQVQDFDEAAVNGANLTTKKYAREQYLRDVIDDLDLRVKGQKLIPMTGNFSDDLSMVEDPSDLPIEMMTDDEMKEVVMIEAAAFKTIYPSDVVEALKGSVTKSEARSLMKETAEMKLDSPNPFSYRKASNSEDETRDRLKFHSDGSTDLYKSEYSHILLYAAKHAIKQKQEVQKEWSKQNLSSFPDDDDYIRFYFNISEDKGSS